MSKVIIVLPNQLFKVNDLVAKRTKDQIFVVEHPIYFSAYAYHKLKLILHRSTMKMYVDHLKDVYEAQNVNYVDLRQYKEFIDKLRKQSAEITMYDPTDHTIYAEFKELGIKYRDSPLFITPIADVRQYYADHDRKFDIEEFYVFQRNRLKLMVDEKGKPWGGSYMFEEERKPFPNDFNVDVKIVKNKSPYVEEAVKYVQTHFSYHVGETKFYLPVNHKQAESFFDQFLAQRLRLFSQYQEAVDPEISVGAHSLISPLINIGLITPQYIVNTAVEYYVSNPKEVSLQCLENFVRQIIGWREYARMVYILEPVKLSEVNYFNHTRKISNGWYTADTGMPPIDDMLKKFLRLGYCHHIERLMYIGNALLMLRIDPKEVFNYFMMFIDAYPWVMEANVFGYSQHSSGKLMTRKPFFSPSSWLLKTSPYAKRQDSSSRKVCRKDWWEIWDALYYSFISDNKEDLRKNHATARAVSILDSKSPEEVKEIMCLVEEYMNNY